MKIIYACKDFDHIELAQLKELSKLPEVDSICSVSCTENFKEELSSFSTFKLIPDLNKRRFHKESRQEFECALKDFSPDIVYSVHGSSLITNIISVLNRPQFKKIAKVSYRGVIGNLHYIFNPESLFTHNSARVDACLGTSEAVVSYLKKQPLIKNKYIDVLYPGVSKEFLENKALEYTNLLAETKDTKLKLGFLGSMKRKIKGFDVLANSILSLPKDLQKQVKLYCIGDQPKNISKYKNCESIVFLGFDKNPWRHFKAFDYLAMPSRLEGLGRAGAEAMALGLPVVTSGAGGIKEYITNDKNGYLIPSNKPEDYKRLWIQLLNDDSFNTTQSRHGVVSKEKSSFFAPEKIAHKLLETFKEALYIRQRKSRTLTKK